MNVVPFDPAHLDIIEGREEEQRIIAALKKATTTHPGWFGNARSGIDDDGRVIASAGVVMHHQGVAHAWCLLSVHARRNAWPVVRAIRAFLMDDETWDGLHRIQMDVLTNWREGERFAMLLGFERETTDRPMRKYRVDQKDAHMWAMVR